MRYSFIQNDLRRFATWRAVVFFGLLIATLGCRKDRLIGLEVQPDGYLDSLQMVDTFTVHARTIESDAQRSTRFRNFVGRLNSDVFGNVESSLYLNFALESENIFLELPSSEYFIEDLILTIFPQDAYGDPSDSLTIDVYQIEELMSVDTAYTSDRSFRLDDQPVGSTTISFESNEDILDLYVSDTSSEDYQGVQIPLSNDLASYLLQGIGTSYSTTSGLRQFFGGLALVPRYQDPSADGGIYNFDVTSAAAGLTMRFSYVDPESGDTLTDTLNYNVITSSTRYNRFQWDYQGSEVQKALDAPGDDEYLFVQGLSGTKARIDFPSLNQFALQKDVAVSLAKLSFELADIQPSDLTPSPTLYLLDYDIDEETGDTIETVTPDYAQNPLRHGGTLDEATGTYSFDITQEVQNIIERQQAGENVNLGYTLNAQFPLVAASANTRYQNVLKGSDNIVLKLYYTDLSE